MNEPGCVGCNEAQDLIRQPDVVLVDVREASERERDGAIPGSVHAPFSMLMHYLEPGGPLATAAAEGKRLLFYCAAGPRSMRATQAARQAHCSDAVWLEGGIIAWAEAGQPLEKA